MATSIYYFAAWTDSGCLLGCDHQHETVISTVSCCATGGSYVVAFENGNLRELNEEEEALFQLAMYGGDVNQPQLLPILIAVLAFLSRFSGYHY